MAAPRVFISSTFYDLRHVREDVGNFISSLGYEPVMHDRGKVTYTQSVSLEYSCYDELQTCDVVVCIIGNKYGTESQDGDMSITMKELMSAIKAKKKIYIYILKEVYYENRTYLKNIDKDFEPASVDNIKIHEFIANVKDNVKNHPIQAFENISDITDNLKDQFAGLFQNLLAKDAAITEEKTAYDLQESADYIKTTIIDFEENLNELFTKINSSVFYHNAAIQYLQEELGHSKYVVFIKDSAALQEYLGTLGFVLYEDRGDYFVYRCEYDDKYVDIIISMELFEDDFTIRKIAKKAEAKELIKFKIEQKGDYFNEEDLPF